MVEREMTLDFQRTERLGFGEAVFCSDKSPHQINEILRAVQDIGSPILVTRLTETKFHAINAAYRDAMNYDPVSETGFFQFAQTPRNSGRRHVRNFEVSVRIERTLFLRPDHNSWHRDKLHL